jgi:hypothetical protein
MITTVAVLANEVKGWLKVPSVPRNRTYGCKVT